MFDSLKFWPERPDIYFGCSQKNVFGSTLEAKVYNDVPLARPSNISLTPLIELLIEPLIESIVNLIHLVKP